ncbi:MAG: TonB family protein [Salinivirgaceae bacterium]
MKTLVQILGLLFIFQVSDAQNTYKKVVNKDATAKKTEIYYTDGLNSDIKEGAYTLKIKGKVRVTGYFKNNKRDSIWTFYHGRIKIEGSYVNGLKEGEWIYTKNQDTLSVLNFLMGKYFGEQKGYYEDGILASKLNYIAGVRNGKSAYYYQSGKLSEDCEYLLGERHGDNMLYDEKGNLIYKFSFYHEVPVQFTKIGENSIGYNYLGNIKDGSGYLKTYSNDKDGERHLITLINLKDSVYNGEIAGFSISDKPVFQGQYKNGFMTGEWSFYNYLGELKTSKTYYVSDSLSSDPDEPITKNYNERFFNVQQMPEFPGGDINLRSEIAKRLIYPDFCKEKRIQGRVFIQFVVNTTGEIEQVKAVKKVHPLLDATAIKVIEEIPPWTPGFQYGIPVKVSFTVPINFSLN